METDRYRTESETPLFLESSPILEFSKKKPFNFSILQFNKTKSTEPTCQMAMTQCSCKTEFFMPPNIQAPSLCDSIKEICSIAEISERPTNLEEMLISCIFRHDISGLEKIIHGNKDHLDFNSRDFNGNTPLTLAVKLAYSHLEYERIIGILIENGADARIRDCNGVSPLEEALAQVFSRRASKSY